MKGKPGPLKVLITRMDCDGHDRGARYVARKLIDEGMEVVFTHFSLPDEVISTALQEDVDLIGLSFLSGAQRTVVPRILEIMDEQTTERIPVLVGGIIPPQDIPALKDMGVLEVFPSGSSIDAITEFIREHVKKRA